VPTLADELGGPGYHTAMVGKWHLGLESPNTPNERGFDFFHGFLGDMMDSYTTTAAMETTTCAATPRSSNPQGHATDLFSDWAADYLRAAP
jgi:arylsulfatase A-like enzyme